MFNDATTSEILITKASEMHYFSKSFDKVLYMFRTGPLSTISRSQHCTHSNTCQFCWLSASRRQQNWHDKYLLGEYSVEILLMMDSGPVRNMYSTLSNKINLRNSASGWLSL